MRCRTGSRRRGPGRRRQRGAARRADLGRARGARAAERGPAVDVPRRRAPATPARAASDRRRRRLHGLGRPRPRRTVVALARRRPWSRWPGRCAGGSSGPAAATASRVEVEVSVGAGSFVAQRAHEHAHARLGLERRGLLGQQPVGRARSGRTRSKSGAGISTATPSGAARWRRVVLDRVVVGRSAAVRGRQRGQQVLVQHLDRGPVPRGSGARGVAHARRRSATRVLGPSAAIACASVGRRERAPTPSAAVGEVVERVPVEDAVDRAEEQRRVVLVDQHGQAAVRGRAGLRAAAAAGRRRSGGGRRRAARGCRRVRRRWRRSAVRVADRPDPVPLLAAVGELADGGLG